MAEAVGEAAGVRRTGVWVYIAELPARQMIEYGYVLPDPGDEEVWTNALPKEDREFMQSVASRDRAIANVQLMEQEDAASERRASGAPITTTSRAAGKVADE